MQLLVVPVQPAWHEQSAMLSLPTAEYVFWGHDWHDVLLPTAYDLAAQFMHVSVAEFRYVENFPAAQSEHASDPGLALYVPGTQPMQLLIVPDQPAWHEQSAMLSLPTGEYVFSGHDTHKVLLPTAYDLAAQYVHVSVAEFRYVENFPAAHREHGSDPGFALYLPATQPVQSLLLPDQPALHEQNVILSLPTGECEFWGHGMHTFLVLFEYSPAKQSVHVLLVEFKATENFPAAQSEHA